MSMSSKPTRIGSAEPLTASTQVETREVPVGNVASDEEIRLRAYEIYLERGETPGLESVGDTRWANWAIKVWHQFARYSSRKPVLRQVLEMVAGVRFELTTFGL